MKLPLKIALSAIFFLPVTVLADGDVELAKKMSHLQYFSHKASLAIEHRNKPLADFYVHELEETIEDVAKIESYDGHPIGKLVSSMLMPSFNQLESALKEGKWKTVSGQFDKMIDACNSCHTATEHGFINIERSSDNPYMQSFMPAQTTKKPSK